jgi:hypothetical protein
MSRMGKPRGGKVLIGVNTKDNPVPVDRSTMEESTTNSSFVRLVPQYWHYHPRIPIDCLK